MERALRGPVLLLGSTQTLAWASSHYLPAILAVPMARDLGIVPATVFAAFSLALLAAAAVGPWCGRMIDRHGGRPVLAGTNLAFAVGIGSLALVQGPWSLMASWLLIGAAMGCGLYDAAFSALARLYGPRARDAIAGITLLGGFASTVGWPLSAWMEAQWGWRGACVAWAAMHLVLGLPLNLLLPRSAAPAGGQAAAAGGAALPGAAEQELPPVSRHAPWLLAFTFAAMGFITNAMAAHLPRLLQLAGATLALAVLAGALIGPAQVAGRLLEMGLMRRLHPLVSARVATLGHPLGVLTLMALGPAAAPVFATLHGLGNGINTIVRGTLPLMLFGARGYGARQGWLTLPARFTAALAPYLAGLALDAWGAATLWLTMALSLSALSALLALHAPAARASPH
ncbi:MAG: MFS transporter [Rubrivivax sp.]|nr:MFS transporter [Rubrivivax sp.]